MANLNIAIQIAAQDNASGVIGRIKGALGGLGDSAQRGFRGLQNVVALAGGAALGGVAALGAGLVGAGAAGLSMNKQMEDVGAQLNAFTKDSEKTAEILEMIRQRAAATPFAFNEMASAAAGLLPSAKQSGAALEDLVSQAEILAASNPAQGLEGAAFALREAVSGDFTSIIERFNLPRQFINQLKEEGVPNLEIVQRAMQELGLDADLVSNLAQTAGGRWSTFLDTLQNVASTVTQPIFDTFSSGLATVNQILADNEPLITGVATLISEKLAGAIQTASDWILTTAIPALREFGNWFLAEGWPAIQQFTESMGPFITQAQEMLAPVFDLVTQFVSWQDVLLALGVVVASIVIPALYGIITAAAPVIAVGAALVGAIALARNAWENDWGGIRTAVEGAIAGFWPFLDQVKLLLDDFIARILPELNAAWVALSDAWTNNIQPALAELWASLQNVFAELGIGTGQTSGWDIALGILKGTLDGVVLVVQVLTPLIQFYGTVAGFMISQVSQQIDRFIQLKRGIEGIIGVIGSAIERVRNFGSNLADLGSKIPSWLIPGSPTPFETGLRGIGRAIDQMPKSLPLSLGGGAPAGSGLALAGAGAGSGGGVTTFQITINANDEAGGRRAGQAFVDELRSRGVNIGN